MLVQRAIRAAKLENSLYDEVEHDHAALRQAAILVVVASLLSGLGSAISTGFSLRGLVGGIVMTLIGWVVWAFATWLVGTRVFGGTADVGEMLRVLGFAYAPVCLGIIPWIGGLVGGIWALICGVVAVRQGLDFSTGKAVATILIALLPAFVVIALLGFLLT